MLANRVMDATLRGGALAGGNREQVIEDINEAIKMVDAMLRPQVSSSIEVLVANQGDYSIATDFLITDLTSIRQVSYTSISGSPIRILEEITPTQLRALRTGQPANTLVYCYAIDGIDKFMVAPVTQVVGDTITITYVPRPASLTNESSSPTGLPEEWHQLYELAAIERSMRQSSPEYAAQYTAMFEHKVGEYRKWRNHRTGTLGTQKPVRGWTFGRLPRYRDNSTDYR